MAAQKPDIHEIFNEAILRDSSEERSQYLNDACGTNAEARQRVDALLCSHSEAGGFLGGQEFSTENLDFAEKIGKQIGPYKLREKIGEGGFGVVYVAEQKQPVSRKVALKVIKPGMDSKDIIARFEAERQALAMMDHPNVAKVLDAGSTDDGRPYFVMELVKGVSITEACDQARLNNRQRLELFVEVCNAVQHAHQKGIIHRDLKPSNVMVTASGDRMIPKVIDFGVAKALHQNLTDKSIYTAYGQLIGTPMYMSPEQAQLSSLDVDTRSDIYSLGVLLYELLTGTTPFDKETFKQAGFDEVRRIIREDEPRRPSDQVTTLHAEIQSTVSEKRRVDHRTLSRSLRGELDWIVMKTLEKDRNRRYETANALSDDLQRFLKNEPVLACPPSTLYRFQKFAKRNQIGIAFTTLTCAFLVVGFIGLGVSNLMLNQSDKKTQAALEQANSHLGDARIANERFLAINDFILANIVDSAAPDKGKRSITVRESILEANDKIESEFPDESILRAHVKAVIGDYLLRIGEYSIARKNLEYALPRLQAEYGADSDYAIEALLDLTAACREEKDLETAIDLAREATGIISSDNHTNQIQLLRSLGATAGSLVQSRELDEARRISLEHLHLAKNLGNKNQVASAYNLLGIGHFYGKNYAEAEKNWNESIAVLDELKKQGSILDAQQNLAKVYWETDRFEKSIELSNKVYEEQSRLRGPDHPKTLSILHELGVRYNKLGATERANESMERLLDLTRRRYGPHSSQTANVMNELGLVLANYGEASQAIEFHLNAKDIESTVFGVEHDRTLRTIGHLATAYSNTGDYQKAREYHEQAIAVRKQRAEQSKDDWGNKLSLGGLYCNYANFLADDEVREFEAASEIYANAAEILKEVQLRAPSQTAREFLSTTYGRWADTLAELRRWGDALTQVDLAIKTATTATQATRMQLKSAKVYAMSASVDEALKIINDVTSELDPANPDNASHFYSAACGVAICAAMDRHEIVDRAIDLLEVARQLNFFRRQGNVDHFERDTDLDGIRETSKFIRFVERLRQDIPDSERSDH